MKFNFYIKEFPEEKMLYLINNIFITFIKLLQIQHIKYAELVMGYSEKIEHRQISTSHKTASITIRVGTQILV